MGPPGSLSKSSSRSKRNRSKDNVKVYARIRKVGKSANQSCVHVMNNTTLQLRDPISNKVTDCIFTRVFNRDVGQKDLFIEVARPLVDDLICGKNGLLFTYGVTNSGKTYTMTGTVKEPGLLPRSLDMIFNSIAGLQTLKYRFIPDDMNGFDIQSEAEALLNKQEKDILPNLKAKKSCTNKGVCYDMEHCFSENVDTDCRYAVFVSYIEIYNECIFDLLGEELIHSLRPLRSKRLREDKKKNMFVHGVTQIEIKTTEEAFAAFQQGQERRRRAHTQLNAESSRSHSIFNIRLVQVPMDPLGEDLLQCKSVICVSQLSLVDLAGTERNTRTGSRNERLREAGSINNSLMNLRRCLVQVRENQKYKSHELVKYRDSKLTYLFKSYFEGHGKVKMILCINPNPEEYEENLHVVQFAEVAQDVEVARSKNVDHETIRRKIINAKIEKLKTLSPTSTATHSSDVASTCSEAFDYSKTDWEGIDFDSGDFPSLELGDCMDTEIMPNLIGYLEKRIAVTSQVKDTVSSMCSLFRKNVANGTLSSRELQSRMAEVESELTVRTEEVAKLDRQVKKLESKNQVLSKTAQIYEKDKKLLQDQLSDFEVQLKNSQREKRQIELKLEEAVTHTKTKVEKLYDRRVRNVQNELAEKIRVKDERFKQLRDILESGRVTKSMTRQKSYTSSIFQSESVTSESSRSNLRAGQRRRSKSEEKHIPAKKKSKTSVAKSSSRSTAFPMHRECGVNVDFGRDNSSQTCPKLIQSTVGTQFEGYAPLAPHPNLELIENNERGDSPATLKEQENPKTLGCRYVNRNDEHNFRHRPAAPLAPKHRRSCSANDSNWLAHFPSTTIQPETILQPCIKPGRVVTVPSPKDVAHASKYLLTHQCEDTDGELETQLVKGDVFHTRTGGQQVQFIDVETLKQSDPQKSSGESSHPFRNHSDDESSEEQGSWTDVETRCAVGVGSGGMPLTK